MLKCKIKNKILFSVKMLYPYLLYFSYYLWVIKNILSNSIDTDFNKKQDVEWNSIETNG